MSKSQQPLMLIDIQPNFLMTDGAGPIVVSTFFLSDFDQLYLREMESPMPFPKPMASGPEIWPAHCIVFKEPNAEPGIDIETLKGNGFDSIVISGLAEPSNLSKALIEDMKKHL